MTKRSKRVGTDDKMIYDDDDNRSRGGNVYFCRLWARGFRWSSSAFSPDACFGLATRRFFVFAFSTFFVSHWQLRGGREDRGGRTYRQQGHFFYNSLTTINERNTTKTTMEYTGERFLGSMACAHTSRVPFSHSDGPKRSFCSSKGCCMRFSKLIESSSEHAYPVLR
jgi:hypothetical protein